MLTIPFMEVAIEEAAGALGLEPAAFRSFYEDALPQVYGYLLHRCGGVSAVAEDLTQETFVAAVAELKKGRRVEAPIPWIYGIARHKLLDHYRRQERIETTVSIDPEPGLSDVAIDESGTDAHESAIAALASVPASQRAVLVLRYLDGYSMSEIAALLEKSEKAVESLLGRGRESFRRAYSEASA